MEGVAPIHSGAILPGGAGGDTDAGQPPSREQGGSSLQERFRARRQGERVVTKYHTSLERRELVQA